MKLFCKHKRVCWVRNIYGDEINYISCKYLCRSEWRCKYCGRIIYKKFLEK